MTTHSHGLRLTDVYNQSSHFAGRNRYGDVGHEVEILEMQVVTQIEFDVYWVKCIFCSNILM